MGCLMSVEKYKLNLFSPIVKRQNEYMFGFNGDFSIERNRTFHLNQKQEQLINRFINGEGIDKYEIENILGEDLFIYFIGKKVIINYEQDGTSIYSRSKALYELNNFGDIQSKLKNKKVLILGCGGIGTHVAWNLTVFGVGEITLLDYDIIEESNLNRQLLFDMNDIGKSKTEVLMKKLKNINKNIEIKTVEEKIESEDQLEKICCLDKYDLVIKSLDSPVEVSKWIDNACFRNKIVSISGITTGISTLVGPTFFPAKSYGFSDIIGVQENSFERLAGNVQSLGVILYHISSEVSVEAVKFLSGVGKLKYVNKICVENIFENTQCILRPQKIKYESDVEKKFNLLQVNLIISLFFSILFILSGFTPILFVGYLYSICSSVLIYNLEENIYKGIVLNVSLYIFVNIIRVFFIFDWKSTKLSEILSLLFTSLVSMSVGIIIACFIGSVINFIKKSIKGRIYD